MSKSRAKKGSLGRNKAEHHDRTEMLELYRMMRTASELEAVAMSVLAEQGAGPGLDASGLEGLAGIGAASRPEDRLLVPPRGAACALVRGVSAQAWLRAWIGQSPAGSRTAAGCAGFAEAGILSSSWNPGCRITTAVGMALGHRRFDNPGGVICVAGSSATADGELTTGLDLARRQRAPLLVIVLGDAREDAGGTEPILDGRDVLAMVTSTRNALATIRQQGGPLVLRAQLDFDGPSAIETLKARLESDSALSEALDQEITDAIAKELREARQAVTEEFFEAPSPYEDLPDHDLEGCSHRVSARREFAAEYGGAADPDGSFLWKEPA